MPDFRDPKQRDAYRNDDFAQPRFDHRKGLFPEDQDESLTTQFSLTMRDLIRTGTAYRAYREWGKVFEDMAQPAQILKVTDDLIAVLPRYVEVQKIARRMIDAYPDSAAARVLGEMMELGDEELTTHPDFATRLHQERDTLAANVEAKKA